MPDVDRTYLFAFDSAANARIFVEKLTLHVRHVAIFVDGAHVRVIDGSEYGQREAILRHARQSGAMHAVRSS